VPDVRVRVDVVDRSREIETPVGHRSDSTDRLPSNIVSAIEWIADALAEADVSWLLTGGSARALSGEPTAPRDIDIEVSATDVTRAGDALGIGVTPTIARRMRSVRGEGTHDEIPIDLSADVAVITPSRLESDFALQWRFSHEVTLGTTVLRLGPEEEPIVRAGAAGDDVRLRRLCRAAMARGVRADYVLARLVRASAAS
jgi:hypothetical protein